MITFPNALTNKLNAMLTAFGHGTLHRRPVGLANPPDHNNCFLNVAAQAFLNVPALHNLVQSVYPSHSCLGLHCVVCSLKAIEMATATRRNVSTYPLRYALAVGRPSLQRPAPNERHGILCVHPGCHPRGHESWVT